MKKLASLVLALIMVFSVAGTAACAENAPVEIEFFTNRSFEGAAATDLEKDNFVEQYLRENLGVDIRYVYTDELTTNLNLRLFSGDVPDVFNVENRNYLKQYADEGYLLNLDEHADKLADAFAFTEGNASAGKIDGATYAIPGRPYGFREAYWYNVNAFKKAGVTEMPTTLTGLVDAVREAMKADVDGNGVNDSIGLTGSGWETLCEIFGVYGVTMPNVLSLDADGHVVDTMLTRNFYDALVYANGLWNEGFIDHEIFSLTPSQAVDKCMTRSAILAELQWPSIKKVAAWEAFLAVDPEAEWEIVGPVTGPDGVTNYVGNYASNAFTSLTCINADLEGAKLEAALKFINFMGTEDGLTLTTYGIKGQHWDYDANGVAAIYPDQVKNVNFSWIYQLCGRDELQYCLVKFGQEANKYIEYSFYQPYITDVTALIDIPEWYNVTDAKTYISEECAKFLTGERELNETEWAKFLSVLDSTYQYTRFIQEGDAAWQAMVG